MTTPRSIGTAAVLLWMLGAPAARADQGYVYALITGGASPTVSAEYSLNPGGAVSVTRQSPGSYVVSFPTSGIGSGWVVLASAYGSTGNYCNPFGWGSSEASVQCYSPNGVAADSAFTVLAISNTNDKDILFALANQPTAASYTPNPGYAYNPAGSIGVTRSSAGTYQVTFNGLSTAGGTFQVAALNSASSCFSNELTSGSIDVFVSCTDASANPLDSEFVVAIVPGGATPTGLSYSFAGDYESSSYVPLPPSTYNSAGSAVGVTRSSTGQYVVTFAGLDAAQVNGGSVLASASQFTIGRCNVASWGAGPGGALQVSVGCYSLAGAPSDTAYWILVLPPMGYAQAEVSGAAAVYPGTTVNPGGQAVTASHNATGQYTVTFPGSGIGAGWSVQAGTIQGSNYCAVSGWNASAAGILCLNSAGAVADTDFTVVAISNTNDKSIAFALADEPTMGSYTPDTNYSYNPAGSITANRTSTGTYNVVFNGLSATAGGTVQVTTFASANTCYSNGWGGSNFEANISCQTPGGAAADSVFAIAVIPAGATPSGIAYAFADQPTTASYTANPNYSYNPGGAVTVGLQGAGEYGVIFPGLNAPGAAPAVLVTPYQTTSRCGTYGVGNNGSELIALVECLNPANALTPSEFQVLVFPPVIGPAASIYPTSGGGQSALVNQPFATAMSATVTDANGNPTPGVTVTFTAPSSAVSGTFPGGSLTATAVGNASGVATAPVFTANNNAGGPYSVSATILGDPNNAGFLLTNTAATSVTMQTVPPGLAVSFNGIPYATPVPFLLTPGSSYTIATLPVQTLAGTQYGWQSWSDGGAVSHTVTVPATAITYTATFQALQYELTISASPAAGGSVTPVSGNFYNAGVTQPVTATANPGYIFAGWTGSVANANSASTTVTMNAPESITANFISGTGISIQTSPSGLQFSVDGGGPQTAPQNLNLTPGAHTIAVAAVQPGGTGTQYAFNAWSDGGAASHSITVGNTAATYTASFTTQYQLTISASPSTGGSVTPASGTFYNAGTVVPVAATANAGYAFTGWAGTVAGASSASTTVTMSAPESVTANFGQSTNITIGTNPSGLQFSVDGGPAQMAPQTLALSQGTHTIAVATPQVGAAGTQYVFTVWSDGGAASHTITVGSSPASYTAVFQTQYQLTITASPAAGGSVTPASGFYNSLTQQPIVATANPGYSFTGWTGAVASASSASTTVAMGAPETVTANFAAVTGITIQTSPNGLAFSVDGGPAQTAPQTLNLSQGTHLLAVASPQAGGAGTQYVFNTWSDGGAASHSIAVGGAAATYVASFQTQYQLTIAASPAAGGSVTPAGGAFYNAGTIVPITASSNAGYSFNGWTGGAVGSASSTSTTVTMSAPESVTANFSSLTGITIQTSPAGLQFSVDGGAPQTAPQSLNLSQGTHTIAVTTPQAGAPGSQYAFTGWSDGGALSHQISVGSGPATYTASFKTQYQLALAASPAVYGSVMPASGGFYDAGTVVAVSAVADAGYSFSSWSGAVANPSAASTTVTMSAAQVLVANFALVTGVTIQTNPAGLQFSVDGGAAQIAPQTLALAQGTHTIAVPTQQAALPGTQFAFSTWSDGGAAAHAITVGASPATYTATFQIQYQLTISASPAAGGTVTPASGGFYNAGTSVPIAATAGSGYTFSGWTGPAANAGSASTTVIMSAAETVTANFSTGSAPPAVTTFAPAQGATGVSTSVTLTWGSVSGATSYSVYFGAYPPALVQSGITGTSYTPTGILLPNATYYWTVTAVNAFGATPSTTWNFTTGAPLRFIPVTPCRVMDTRNVAGTFGGPSVAGGATRIVPVPLSACNIPTANAYSLNITVVPPGPLTYLTIWPTGQPQPLVSTLNSYDGRVVANAAIVPAGNSGEISVFVSNTTDVVIDINGYFAPALPGLGLPFETVTPCRVTDTRGATGPFGGPFMSANSTRSFTIPASSCNIPDTAQAYSLNITVVPHAPLNYLTTWPTGQPQPYVSTLNSLNGSIVANAAIVPAGVSGAISVFVTGDTDLIIDINGYFAPANSTGLSLYTLTPCRVLDTRNAAGAFGGPIFTAGGTRSFNVPESSCSVPSSAQAYSFNVTVVPPASLLYLTAWPQGQTQPVVSTLNSPNGAVLANAAIVPSGGAPSGPGGVSIFVSDATDVILDINAYFAQ